MTNYSSDEASEKGEKKVEKSKTTCYEKTAIAYLNDRTTLISKGQAYQYTGTHYAPVDKLKINLRKWMSLTGVLQDNKLVDNVAPIVEAYATTDYDLPCWLDGRKERIIPFTNGLYRLNGDELAQHTLKYQSSWCIPCEYDTTAKCPMWLDMVAESLNGEMDQVALSQEWFGYSLSGDTSRQVYMTHVGARGSGKSTIANILMKLMGDGATAFNMRQLAGRFGLTGLQGKSLAVCGEVELTGCKERAEIIERLKSITGNDTQKIERKGDNFYPSVVLPVRFHLISNSMPVLRDPTLALARRMLILWSPSAAKSPDAALETKFLTELPGIVQWGLEGYRRLEANGRFTQTSRMKSEIEAIEREASPFIGFVRDCCELPHLTRWRDVNRRNMG